MTLRTCLLAVLAFVLASTPVAAASVTWTLGRVPPVVGPQWVGDRVTIVQPDARDDSIYRIRQRRQGSAWRTIATFQQIDQTGGVWRPFYGAFSSRRSLLLSAMLPPGVPSAGQYRTDMVDASTGVSSIDHGCQFAGAGTGHRPEDIPVPSIDADAAGYAYLYDPTEDGLLNCELRYQSSPGTRARTLATNAGGPQLAGRFIAWLAKPHLNEGSGVVKTDLVVYDRVARRVRYRVSSRRLGAAITSYDLQADGKTALALTRHPVGGARTTRIAWTSSTGRLRRIALKVAAEYFVRLRRDRVVFQRGDVGGSARRATIGVSDLRGHTRILTRAAFIRGLAGNLDYDGRRIAWLTQLTANSSARLHIRGIGR
jgi:hypothetical protein